ncbi:hypothetical protein LSH36_315g03009, partial [Paralvinella palmiformis]
SLDGAAKKRAVEAESRPGRRSTVTSSKRCRRLELGSETNPVRSACDCEVDCLTNCTAGNYITNGTCVTCPRGYL